MKKIFYTAMILFTCFLTIGTVLGAPEDWLNKSYKYSHRPPSSDKPYTSDIEADDMFNSNGAIGVGPGGVSISTSDSVLVRLARFLMRIGVMLGVPIIIFGGIKIALSFGDTGKLKEALKLLGYMIGGLLLILLSVMIVFLLTSLTRSSLPLFVE